MKRIPILLVTLCLFALAAENIAADAPQPIPGADSSPARAETAAKVRILTGHSGSVLAIVFSPDGKVLVTGGGDTSVRLWDMTGSAE